MAWCLFSQHVRLVLQDSFLYPIGSFSNASLLVLAVLMFIGASPASTGGGIKTTTFFTLLQATKSAATNSPLRRFQAKDPNRSHFEDLYCHVSFCDGRLYRNFFAVHSRTEQFPNATVFEVTSAFGTVGLSTGITPYLMDAVNYC